MDRQAKLASVHPHHRKYGCGRKSAKKKMKPRAPTLVPAFCIPACIGATAIATFWSTPRPDPAAAATLLLVCCGPAPSTSICMTEKLPCRMAALPGDAPVERPFSTGDTAMGAVVGVWVCDGVSEVHGEGTKSLTRKREH